MNRLLFGMMLLAVGCLAGSCTDDDEYTQGVWMRRSDLDGVARGQASSFTIDNNGYLCCGFLLPMFHEYRPLYLLTF